MVVSASLRNLQRHGVPLTPHKLAEEWKHWIVEGEEGRGGGRIFKWPQFDYYLGLPASVLLGEGEVETGPFDLVCD